MGKKQKLARREKEYEKEEPIEEDTSQNCKNEENMEADSYKAFDDFEELTGDEVPISYEIALREWVAMEELQEYDFCGKLLKYEHPLSGKRKAFIDEYTEAIPSPHEVGLKHGGGRYVFMLSFPGVVNKKNRAPMKSIRFTIHSRYDQLKLDQLKIPVVPALMGSPAVNISQPTNSIDGTLLLMERLMGIVVPLIAQKNPPQSDKMENFVIDTYKGVQKVCQQNALDNTQFMNDFTRRSGNLPEVMEDESEVTGINALLEKFSPYLDMFSQMLVGRQTAAKKTQAAMAAKVIRSTADYKELTKSKAQLKQVIDFIDRKQKPEITDKMLELLKINRE